MLRHLQDISIAVELVSKALESETKTSRQVKSATWNKQRLVIFKEKPLVTVTTSEDNRI